MSEHPSYCCRQCGECIGWVGRAFQAVLGPYAPHDCKHRRKIMADAISELPGPNPATDYGKAFYEGRSSAIHLLDPYRMQQPTSNTSSRSGE